MYRIYVGFVGFTGLTGSTGLTGFGASWSWFRAQGFQFRVSGWNLGLGV